jgi:MFS family permease
MMIATLGFLSLYKVDDSMVFFGLAIAFRFIQGIGGTILQVTGQAIVLSEYGGRKEVVLAYLSAARGLGYLGGPLSGQFFYSTLGYMWTFGIFGIVLLLAMLQAQIRLPSYLNINNQATDKAKRATARLSQMQKTVTYWEIFKIKRAAFCLITVIFALMFSAFFEPFMSDHLTSIGFKSDYVGYLFAIFATTYTIAAFLVGPLTKRMPSRYISFMSYIIIAIACVLYGPSNIFLKNDCLERFKQCQESVHD